MSTSLRTKPLSACICTHRHAAHNHTAHQGQELVCNTTGCRCTSYYPADLAEAHPRRSPGTWVDEMGQWALFLCCLALVICVGAIVVVEWTGR